MNLNFERRITNWSFGICCLSESRSQHGSKNICRNSRLIANTCKHSLVRPIRTPMEKRKQVFFVSFVFLYTLNSSTGPLRKNSSLNFFRNWVWNVRKGSTQENFRHFWSLGISISRKIPYSLVDCLLKVKLRQLGPRERKLTHNYVQKWI